jgi:chromosome segregation ATPase
VLVQFVELRTAVQSLCEDHKRLSDKSAYLLRAFETQRDENEARRKKIDELQRAIKDKDKLHADLTDRYHNSLLEQRTSAEEQRQLARLREKQKTHEKEMRQLEDHNAELEELMSTNGLHPANIAYKHRRKVKQEARNSHCTQTAQARRTTAASRTR